MGVYLFEYLDEGGENSGGSLVKVGFHAGDSPWNRLTAQHGLGFSAQLSPPHLRAATTLQLAQRLRLLAWCPAANRNAERCLHSFLKPFRETGEWYRLDGVTVGELTENLKHQASFRTNHRDEVGELLPATHLKTLQRLAVQHAEVDAGCAEPPRSQVKKRPRPDDS